MNTYKVAFVRLEG
jgi:hypothetical protein